jgi:hypothetical protein
MAAVIIKHSLIDDFLFLTIEWKFAPKEEASNIFQKIRLHLFRVSSLEERKGCGYDLSDLGTIQLSASWFDNGSLIFLILDQNIFLVNCQDFAAY